MAHGATVGAREGVITLGGNGRGRAESAAGASLPVPTPPPRERSAHGSRGTGTGHAGASSKSVPRATAADHETPPGRALAMPRRFLC